jgi:predicted nuclease of predicted toxin-antitoxin system
MILWVDAQLSPALAPWITNNFEGVEAYSVRNLGLRDATDREIWEAARRAYAVVMTKDRDFLQMLDLHGPPPKIIWVTCGNTSNAGMREILTAILNSAIRLLESGEALVEITDLA